LPSHQQQQQHPQQQQQYHQQHQQPLTMPPAVHDQQNGTGDDLIKTTVLTTNKTIMAEPKDFLPSNLDSEVSVKSFLRVFSILREFYFVVSFLFCY